MQSTNASKRLRVVERDDYAVDLEYNEEFLIIHLPYVWKFNKGVFTDMLFTLENFSDFFKVSGFKYLYAAVDMNNLKIRRLLVKLGFKRKANQQDLTVYEKEL
jgi:RimJ/RimL family protein N-acetyltransferase